MPSSSSLVCGWECLSAMPINENCVSRCLEQGDTDGSFGLVASKLNELEPCSKFEPWTGLSSMMNVNSMPFCSKDQAPSFPKESNLPKVVFFYYFFVFGFVLQIGEIYNLHCMHVNPVDLLSEIKKLEIYFILLYLPYPMDLLLDASNIKDLGVNDSDDLCEGLNMGGVPLNLKNNEIFGCPQGPTGYQIEDGGMECLSMEKNLSVTEFSGTIENALEASSSGQQDCVAFQSSQVGGSTNILQAMNGSSNCLLMNGTCAGNINLAFPSGQVHSSMSLSLSNITGESSAADYQDCGLSPVFLTVESPWESNLEATSPQARDKAKMRYNEKKKSRTDQFFRLNATAFDIYFVMCIAKDIPLGVGSSLWIRAQLHIYSGIVQGETATVIFLQVESMSHRIAGALRSSTKKLGPPAESEGEFGSVVQFGLAQLKLTLFLTLPHLSLLTDVVSGADHCQQPHS
ncbi:Zinc finger protein CONSTANS-LIKE 12 [Morella rubra]|uniref:Zinc finger protein CONSTANS-LIKE 12 n=1 Tax=Morella rubra TaxID=262757 RepID=A0A6A1WMW1_9ROSI|nr:Zinc finger protein CONSTANS-LIKE 12 [Morella rubra]